jgi:hypothetical protein
LIERGLSLRENGNDEQALELFKEALRLSPSPRAQAQVALAEQALGLWVVAEHDLSLALESTEDSWIAKHRTALLGALAYAQRHLGTLELRGTPNAEVLIDGVRIGRLSDQRVFRVEAGTRAVEVRAAGFHSTRRTVDIAPFSLVRETIQLVRTSEELPGADSAQGKPTLLRIDDPGRVQRTVGWWLAGAGGAALALGGVTVVVHKSVVDGYNDACPGLGVAQSEECEHRISAARTWLTASWISLVAGGVLAAGGLSAVALAKSPKRSSVNAVACLPRGAGFDCFVRF